MDAKDIRNLQEAYLEVYQEQQLDEGLKKAFIKAYGRAYATAGDDYADEDDFEREAKIRSHIERRYGPETAKHADEHGYVQSTGRRYGRPEPRIQPNRKFKTTKAGKMPKNAQKAFKNELILNKSERDSPTIGGVRKPKHWGKVGGEKGLPEQVDLYDIILSHLLDEGYAETPEAAEAIMVNMSEDWRESICEGYKKLPVGKMIKQAAYKAYYASKDDGDEKVDKQVAKMAKVADTHNPNKSKRKEDDNRREGGRKRDAGRPRSNELQDNW
jgi:hypothetical protein